jgi:hypothetical protein
MPPKTQPDPEYRDLPAWATEYDASGYDPFSWTADVLGFALDAETASLHALLVVRGREPFRGLDAWPGGFVDARTDLDSRAAARRELREETGQDEAGFVEELGTYGRLGRDPRQFAGRWDADAGRWVERGARVVTTAHLALMRKEGRDLAPEDGEDSASAAWAGVYDYLPWEDLRGIRGRTAAASARAALMRWAAAGGIDAAERTERVERAFGSDSGKWNEELVAERHRLLFDAGLLEEAHRDKWGRVKLPSADAPPSRASAGSALDEPASTEASSADAAGSASSGSSSAEAESAESGSPERGAAGQEMFGRAMAFDHREMMADALGRLRGKLKYVPRVMQALVGDRFTLDELQGAFEAVAGRPLHRPNFRRVVSSVRSAIVEPTGSVRESSGPGVDPQLFAFRPRVIAARLEVSMRLPWTSLTGGG